MNKLKIAVDGPAASGKGTVSRFLCERYNLAFLDTGLLYRASGLGGLSRGGSEADYIEAAKTLTAAELENPELRSRGAGQQASVAGKIKEVREALYDFQVTFANTVPEGKNGVLLDGRDIGTVICPDAPLKFFVTADVEARAQRRFQQLSDQGENVAYEDILADLTERDKRDSERADAPLKAAEEAILVDSTSMTIPQVEAFVEKEVDLYLKTL